MSEIDDVRNLIRTLLSGHSVEFKAVMGKPDGTVKSVEPNAGPNDVYVTLYNDDVITVFNQRLALVPYKKIIIGYDYSNASLFQVLRYDGVYGDQPNPSMGPHRDTHSAFGYDPIDIYAEQFMPLLPRATGGFTVRVYPGWYVCDDLKHVLPQTDIDLSGEVVTSGAEWVNVEVDSGGIITFQHSGNVATRSLLIPEDIPDTDSDKKLLCSIKMYEAQAQIAQAPGYNDVYDPRFGGGGGGSLPALTAGRVVITDPITGDIITDPKITYDATTNKFIIGGTPPAVANNSGAINSDGTTAPAWFYWAYNNLPGFNTFFFANGAQGAETGALINQIVCRFGRARPHDGSAYANTQAEIVAVANENYAPGAHGTRIETKVTPDGTTTEIIANTSEANGDFSVEGHNITNLADPINPQDGDTKAARDAAIASAVTGLWDDRGNFNASVNAYPSSGGSGVAGAIVKGDIWTISVAGTLPTGQVVEVGDTVRALIDTPGNTQANWAIAQNNIGYVPENATNKDSSGGYVGLTLFKINFKNVLNTFTSFFTNSNTAARTYTFQNRDGTIADDTDLAGKQPLDSDLTTIAAITPANDDVIQRKAGAWTNRTIAQLIVDIVAAGLSYLSLTNRPATAYTNTLLADQTGQSTSGFTGTIATLPGGAPTTLTYTPVSGNEDTLVPTATTYGAKQRLYNTNRGNSIALITNSNAGTNTITFTANVPGTWLVGDTITTLSPTVVGGGFNWVDFEIQSGSAYFGKSFLFMIMAVTDTGGAGGILRMHPFQTYNGALVVPSRTDSTQRKDALNIYTLVSNVLTVSWVATGAGTLFFQLKQQSYNE